MFPQFWDGKSLAGTNFKDHMAYDRGGDGGPSSHPYLLPELQLQIHYGRVPEDASLVLTSDSMTADRPDYARLEYACRFHSHTLAGTRCRRKSLRWLCPPS